MSVACIVSTDRVQFIAWLTSELPEFPGFQVCSDRLVRSQTSIKTYCRLRIYKNRETRTTIYLQHRPACPWLAPTKVTVVREDDKGLDRSELEKITGAFKKILLITDEVAFDFPPCSGIDRNFVLRHAIVGKSQLVGGRPYGDLRYGTRHSATMVRAYGKPEIRSYRIEIELHSSWLRKNGLKSPEDLSTLSGLLLPRRLEFMRIDWASLSAHLSRKGLPAERLITRTRSKAYSLARALKYLRDEVGLSNVHRFLRPLQINRLIQKQLQAWADRWRCSPASNSGATNA